MKKLLAVLMFAVASLTASSVFAQVQNTLTWTNATGNDGTAIERKAEACAGPGAFTEIGTVAVGVSTYVDKAVTQGQFYCYQARHTNGTARSSPSNMVGRLVPFVVPSAPTNLNVGP